MAQKRFSPPRRPGRRSRAPRPGRPPLPPRMRQRTVRYPMWREGGRGHAKPTLVRAGPAGHAATPRAALGAWAQHPALMPHALSMAWQLGVVPVVRRPRRGALATIRGWLRLGSPHMGLGLGQTWARFERRLSRGFSEVGLGFHHGRHGFEQIGLGATKSGQCRLPGQLPPSCFCLRPNRAPGSMKLAPAASTRFGAGFDQLGLGATSYRNCRQVRPNLTRFGAMLHHVKLGWAKLGDLLDQICAWARPSLDKFDPIWAGLDLLWVHPATFRPTEFDELEAGGGQLWGWSH